jgi:hypothetical protein
LSIRQSIVVEYQDEIHPDIEAKRSDVWELVDDGQSLDAIRECFAGEEQITTIEDWKR